MPERSSWWEPPARDCWLPPMALPPDATSWWAMRSVRANNMTRLLIAFAASVAAAMGAQADACGLLTADAIRRATGEQVANAKATAQTAGKLRQSQCFYALPTFTNSISLTLTSA